MPKTPSSTATTRFLRETWDSEHSVYGAVLVSALVAVGWEFNTDLQVLGFIVGTVAVFWLTHVYAGAVSSRRTEEGRAVPVWRAVLGAARHSSGMVMAMLLPVAFLALASFGVLDEYVAYYLALWVGVAVLAVIGYVNAARNHSPWGLRILAALVTAGLGLAVIWLSALVH